MVAVSKHTRHLKNKVVPVNNYNRKSRKLPNYDIEEDRQHKPKTSEYGMMIDASVRALPPGKRISKNKNIYYERRFNRSDYSGTL